MRCLTRTCSRMRLLLPRAHCRHTHPLTHSHTHTRSPSLYLSLSHTHTHTQVMGLPKAFVVSAGHSHSLLLARGVDVDYYHRQYMDAAMRLVTEVTDAHTLNSRPDTRHPTPHNEA